MNRKELRLLTTVLCAITVLAGLLLSPQATAAEEGSISGELVLWNKLGSEEQVTNSLVGASFETRPGVIYVDGVYDGALATTEECAYLAMSPDDFFPADRTQGTIEVWIQKRMEEFIPYETPLVGVFGYHPYGNNYCGGNGYDTIAAFWSDGFTGQGGLQFHIRDSDYTAHIANDLAWDDVSVGQWVHVAFVWDLDGIDGTPDKLRIYRDGAVVAANADSIPDIQQNTAQVRILGHHAYDRFGQPTAYLDNLKVWDYAKINFDNRFSEGTAVSVTIEPQEAIDAGAQWRLVLGPDQSWHDSGDVITDVPPGLNAVVFNWVHKWRRPRPQLIQVTEGSLTHATGTYVGRKVWSLKITLEP